MYGKMLVPLAVAALLSSHPASAADEIDGIAVPTDATGIRIEGARNEFQLVTHGVWRPASPLTKVEGETSSSARVEAIPVRLLKPRSASSSFRRAAYLPHVYAAEIQNRLPTGLLDALVWTESRYNPFAVSQAGAAGDSGHPLSKRLPGWRGQQHEPVGDARR